MDDAITLPVTIHDRTATAIKVSRDGRPPVWLNLLQIELRRGEDRAVILTVPVWLAEKEGLINV